MAKYGDLFKLGDIIQLAPGCYHKRLNRHLGLYIVTKCEAGSKVVTARCMRGEKVYFYPNGFDAVKIERENVHENDLEILDAVSVLYKLSKDG